VPPCTRGSVHLSPRFTLPPLTSLQAVDAALHVAEHEVATLSSERSKLMNMLDSSEPEEVADPAAEEDLAGGISEAFSYQLSVKHLPDPCANPSNAINNPQCQRVAHHAEEEVPLPRIYVYDVPSKFTTDMSRKWKRCSTDQYGTEVFFHEALMAVGTTDISPLLILWGDGLETSTCQSRCPLRHNVYARVTKRFAYSYKKI